MAAPGPRTAVRLRKLVLLLSSDQPGEVAAAATAIGRALAADGATWHDLAERLADDPPSPARCPEASDDWRALVERLRRTRRLNTWERKFLRDIAKQSRPPSAKQWAVLRRISLVNGGRR